MTVSVVGDHTVDRLPAEASAALHAVWRDDSLFVWGEQPGKLKTRTSKSDRLKRHPFAMTAEKLNEITGINAGSTTTVLNLPSTAYGPQASPSPWAGSDSDDDNYEMRRWKAAAVELTGDDIVPWLNRLNAIESAQLELVIGDSIRYIAVVFDFARELVGRGRMLPGVVNAGRGRFEARWRPVVFGADVPRLRALVTSMPLSLAPTISDIDTQGLVRDMLEVATDTYVRSVVKMPKGARRSTQSGNALIFGLCRTGVEIDASSGEVEKMSQALDEWRASTNDVSAAVRTCFRLVPPLDDNDDQSEDPTEGAEPQQSDSWRLEFHLQSLDDPSLIVGAPAVWNAGKTLEALGPDISFPQEQLLSDLGRSARLYPSLIPCLDQPCPTHLDLDAHGAAEFLQNGARILEESGYGVLLPSWWGTRKAKLGVKLHAISDDDFEASPAAIGEQGICDYRLDVALGDETLTKAELDEIARLKMPLVRVRGQWVHLNDRDLDAALKIAKKRGKKHGSMSPAQVLRVGLGLESLDVDLPVTSLSAQGWLGELLGGDQKSLGDAPPIDGFTGQLRPYQEKGLAWLWFFHRLGMGACLADDMGLGKTAQLLSLLVAERQTSSKRSRKKRSAPTLVVCPMSLVGNWQREAQRFAPDLRVYVHHGSDRAKSDLFKSKIVDADLVLTTYALATRDRALLTAQQWGRVVLDEAQNIKNSTTRQSKAVRALPAHRRLALTGTPVENRLGDLWSIFDFLNPGLLGSEDAFKERFTVPIEQNGNTEVTDTLRRITSPFVLRRLKTDRSIITDLPDKLEMKTYCNLTREQASLYKAIVDEMMERLKVATGIERRGIILSTMTKLKQVCNHPAHFLGDGSDLGRRSGKLAVLEETLGEVLAEGERALVFTQFTEMGTLLQRYLQQNLRTEVLWLHGGTSKRARDRMVERFQSADNDAPRIFLISLKAGGTGLNLTAANHVVHFDRWWNPAVEDQATDRAFRIGQTRSVQVRKLICVGTLEERVDEMMESKRSLADKVVGSGEGWVTELSTAAIRELVALSADAVGAS
jgi:superfamily II DNA or RNA helicase